MDTQLSSQEIGVLLMKAQRNSSAVRAAEGNSNVLQFDLKQSSPLSNEQAECLTTLHKTLAVRLSEVLTAFLRMPIEMKFESVEQIMYGEFLKQQADPTYLASVRTPSPDACSILQVDLSLVFPLVDMILGGSGQILPEARDLTEIEEEIFQTISEIVCRELQFTWLSAMEINFDFEQRQRRQSSTALIPVSERTMVLTFNVQLSEAAGKSRIVLPPAIYTELLKKLIVQPVSTEPVNTARNRARLQEALMGSSFHAEMALPVSQVSVGEIFNLKVGSVLPLEPQVTEPIHVMVAGKSMFVASPVRCGSQRGAQIEQVLSLIPKQGKEKQ